MNDRKISALIVDDELLGRDLVRHMAEANADVEIVGECASVKLAVEEMKRCRPQLVFLDVEMPGANGFDLIGAFESSYRPWVVFVTAYSTHAVKAFEARAVDYLQKPFSQERFDQAVARVRERCRIANEAELGRKVQGLLGSREKGSRTPFLQRIAVKSAGKVYFVAVEDIDCLIASRNYVELRVGDKTHLVYETLARMEQQLDPVVFLRIHRSQIVNVSRIRELRPHFNGEYIVVLESGARLKISRSYRDRANEVLGLD